MKTVHMTWVSLFCSLLVIAGCAQFVDSDPFSAPEPARASYPPFTAADNKSGPITDDQSKATGPRLFPGTGVFVDSRSRPVPVTTLPSGNITLNFANADIREVVRAVISDTLGQNYMIDPKVQGKITLQTSRPIARSAVLPVLENVLRLNGAALLNGDGFYRIVVAENAARVGIHPAFGMSSGPRGRGFMVQIVPLEHVSAIEMSSILEPYKPTGGTIKADTARNLLIMTGTSQELSGLIDMVETFDVDWLAGMSFGIFPLESTDARSMANDLKEIFGDEKTGPLAGLIRFVPLERMNSILVVASRPHHLQQAREWIERFDTGAAGSGQRLYVYYIENRRAEDLAPVLTEIFSNRNVAAQPEARLAPGLQPKTVASAPAAAPRPAPPGNAKTPAGASQRAKPDTSQSVTVEAEPAGRAVAGSKGVGRGVGFAPEGEIRIIADDKKNALLILASPRDYKIIEIALKKLDVVPLQVLIEATIAEVTLNDELEYGLQWFFESGQSQTTLTELATGVVSANFPGFSYFFTPGNARVALSALDKITDVKVISSPQLMVLDNETATLQVGDQVPIATQSAVTTDDPDAPIVNSIQMLDTGVILEVTPRVNANGLVILDILQEVSDATSTSTSGIDSPTIAQRRITSSVAIQSGETVALGGLIKDTDNVVESGVPLLMNIPILGNLFKKTTDTKTRTELLILLTPRVIRDQAEARQVTDELRRKLRGLRALDKKLGR